MRILFIGNSHTYYQDMPYMAAELLRAAGQEVFVTILTRGGQSLGEHIQNEQTRFNLLYGGYDWVIVQQVTSDFPPLAENLRDAKRIKDWCDQAGSAMALYMNFESPCDTPPLAEMAPKIEATARALEVPVARIGLAMQKAAALLPEQDFYFTDRHHASPLGAYLIALTLVHDVFGIRAQGLPETIAAYGETIFSAQPGVASALQKLVDEL